MSQWVILWTDALVYVLVVASVLFWAWARGQAHLRKSWAHVWRRRQGRWSLLVLSVFIVIALLDSVNFRAPLDNGTSTLQYSIHVESVLDHMLGGIHHHQERSYSAPFATHLYDKETIQLPNGETRRDYVPLKYPGTHWLGTDKVGQDVFYMGMKSIRTGLVIGTLTTLIMLPFALLLGIAAGYFRGWVDDVIQYLYTTLSSVPGVLLIASAILSVQVFMAKHPDWFHTVNSYADARLLALCMILGLTSWTSLCRILRGETLKIREMDYIQAARTLAVKRWLILLRHVIPNVMHIVLITLVLDFSGLVLAEAVLSYVGVGVDPTTHSWGNMINAARLELAQEPLVWWPILTSFLFMFTLVLAANLFADTVRDAFDPRQQ